MVALVHRVGWLCRLCLLLLHFLLPYKGKLSAFGSKCSRKTVEWVVNVGHKLVLLRLDCCVGGECWTQVGAVLSGLLCGW